MTLALLLSSLVLVPDAHADDCVYWPYTACNGGGANDICDYTGGGLDLTCDLQLNPGTGDGVLTAITSTTGSGQWEIWGVDEEGNNFCCEMAPPQRYFYVYGTTQNDAIALQNVDGATTYNLEGATAFVYSLQGTDDIFGADTTSTLEELWGGPGIDYIWGYAGVDLILGEQDADVLWGGDDADEIDGGTGNDEIHGGYGDDVIHGGETDAGADRVKGDDGNDVIDGWDGDDMLCGGNGDDILDGEGGDDDLYGGNNVDTIDGGGGTSDNCDGPSTNCEGPLATCPW